MWAPTCNQRFGLSFTAVGLIVGTFAIGGLLYAGTVAQLVNLLGQRGLAIGGGALCGIAYLMLAPVRPGGSRRSPSP